MFTDIPETPLEAVSHRQLLRGEDSLFLNSSLRAVRFDFSPTSCGRKQTFRSLPHRHETALSSATPPRRVGCGLGALWRRPARLANGGVSGEDCRALLSFLLATAAACSPCQMS